MPRRSIVVADGLVLVGGVPAVAGGGPEALGLYSSATVRSVPYEMPGRMRQQVPMVIGALAGTELGPRRLAARRPSSCEGRDEIDSPAR